MSIDGSLNSNSSFTQAQRIQESLNNPDIQALLKNIKPNLNPFDRDMIADSLSHSNGTKSLELLNQIAKNPPVQAFLAQVVDSSTDSEVGKNLNAFITFVKELAGKDVDVTDLVKLAALQKSSKGTYSSSDVMANLEKIRKNQIPLLVTREEAGFRPISNSNFLLANIDTNFTAQQINLEHVEETKSKPALEKQPTILDLLLPKLATQNPTNALPKANAYVEMPPPEREEPKPQDFASPKTEVREEKPSNDVQTSPAPKPVETEIAKPASRWGSIKDIKHSAYKSLMNWGKNAGLLENFSKKQEDYKTYAAQKSITEKIMSAKSISIIDRLNPFSNEKPPKFDNEQLKSMANVATELGKIAKKHTNPDGTLDPIGARAQTLLDSILNKVEISNDKSTRSILNYNVESPELQERTLSTIDVETSKSLRENVIPGAKALNGSSVPLTQIPLKLMTESSNVSMTYTAPSNVPYAAQYSSGKMHDLIRENTPEGKNSSNAGFSLISTLPSGDPFNLITSNVGHVHQVGSDQNQAGAYSLMIVADGCKTSTGEISSVDDKKNARTAAETAVEVVNHHIVQGLALNPPNNVHEMANLVLSSLSTAQDVLAKAAHQPENNGSTTVNIALEFTANNGKRYLMNFNVGDTKTFVITPDATLDITANNRKESKDDSDPGGNLGPSPDIRNLSHQCIELPENALVLNLSDAVYDNLDPELMGLNVQQAVNELKLNAKEMPQAAREVNFAFNDTFDNWSELDNNLPLKNDIKTKFREYQLRQLVAEGISNGHKDANSIARYINDQIFIHTVELRKANDLAELTIEQDYKNRPGKLGDAIILSTLRGDINRLT